MADGKGQCLADVSPELERALTSGVDPPPLFPVAQIRCETVWVTMRDGVRLATDLYLPPVRSAPVIAMRSPYGRANDRFVGAFLCLRATRLCGESRKIAGAPGTASRVPGTTTCMKLRIALIRRMDRSSELV